MPGELGRETCCFIERKTYQLFFSASKRRHGKDVQTLYSDISNDATPDRGGGGGRGCLAGG